MGAAEIIEVRQYLAFTMGAESFALDVARVREILEFTHITRVPGAPGFMMGVINLRGNVVPVLDMRLKLGVPDVERTVDTCIIVVEVPFDGENTVMGALVDSVQEVFELGAEEIESAPRVGTGIKKELLRGIGKKEGGFIMILDAEKIFSAEELVIAEGRSQDGEPRAVAEG